MKLEMVLNLFLVNEINTMKASSGSEMFFFLDVECVFDYKYPGEKYLK